MANNEGEVRFGRRFGLGEVWGAPGHELSKMGARKRLFAMGYSHACPVVLKVEEEYGKEWAFNRYLECNWVFDTVVLKRAAERNPELYRKLTAAVPRLPGEVPDPKIDQTLVPPSFETEMSPLSTAWGYAIPRMILVARQGEDGKGSRTKVSQIEGILEQIIPTAVDPIDLTLKLGERLLEAGADEGKLIYHLMSAGVLKEEGCKTMYREFLDRMRTGLPKLYEAYQREAGINKEVIAPGQLE